MVIISNTIINFLFNQVFNQIIWFYIKNYPLKTDSQKYDFAILMIGFKVI